LFITGTDTGVGKTRVACLIARAAFDSGVRVGVYKPVCSGAFAGDPPFRDDVERLAAAAGHLFPQERICPQRFAAPVAPPLAARLEGRQVDSRLLRQGAHWWAGQVDLLLVEGAGGLLSPIADDETVADLAMDLGYPLLIVAADRLGTINHTLLTVEAAKSRDLRIAGVVVNRVTGEPDASSAGNAVEIARRCGAPVLGVVGFESHQMLRPGGGGATIDWVDLAAESPPRDQQHDSTN
jgi:dethiobiotin synthetase